MRTDYENLADGQRLILYPNDSNPLHKQPITASYAAGYFYCDGTPPMDGPDYYFGDVAAYCEGFELEEHPND